MDRNLAALKEIGNAHLLARRFDAASDAYEEAAHLSELPRGGLCVKLARAHLAAGRPEAAIPWLMQVVDPAASFRTWAAAAGLLSRCPVETWPGVRRHLTVGLVGTWTTSTFAPLLRLAAARLGLALTIHQPDFGQYFNATLDPDSAILATNPDVLILAPEHRALGVRPFSDTPEPDAEAEVARWSGIWSAVRRRAAPTILQMGFAVPGSDPLGHHAIGLDGSRRSVIGRINRDLAHRAVAEDVGFIDLSLLANRSGTQDWFDDRGWYMAKMPYAPDSLPVMARHTAAVLAARLGLSRRAIVLDLDNTLWGGVIGDDGLDGIVLGGGTAGEAFQDFQVALKEMVDRGILLAVCSKNDPEVALAPFRKHPEMVLKEEDVAAFVANWEPKSRNIRRHCRHPRARARQLHLPRRQPLRARRGAPGAAASRRADAARGPYRLPPGAGGLSLFRARRLHRPPTATAPGSTARARRRSALQAEAGSLEDYQASLNMQARSAPSTRQHHPRGAAHQQDQPVQPHHPAAQQGRARGLPRPQRCGRPPGAPHRPLCRPWAHRRGAGRDPETVRPRLEIDTLLMSCRVLGRGVEALVLAELGRRAAEAGCTAVTGAYIRHRAQRHGGRPLPPARLRGRPAGGASRRGATPGP